MDLTPELRNRVYAFYMSEFDNVLLAPTQPPLTQASSQLRQEALPIFYRTCTFCLTLQVVPYGLLWGLDTDLFIKSLRPSSLAMIRNIQLQLFDRGEDMVYHPFDRVYGIAIDVRLGNGRKPCAVDLLQRLKADEFRWNILKERVSEFEVLENNVKAVFEVVSRRVDDQTGERAVKLTIEDLLAARRVMEPSFVRFE
ncbi:hypothetical protein CBER1_08617 [Cercospora berteroae]|uniref:Uncharacterized protein n=1 Tax=Cercospora berteroae TaxID=357750 RepID=A0A2S6BV44_9PEZI|nr:hypothetical protein CBER1_08617 [Cercospora berteroae]